MIWASLASGSILRASPLAGGLLCCHVFPNVLWVSIWLVEQWKGAFGKLLCWVCQE